MSAEIDVRGRQSRVATLLYKDGLDHGGSKGAASFALMKSLAMQRQKAAALGCALPKGI